MTTLSHAVFLRSGTFFFTVRLKDPEDDLLVRRMDALRQSFRECRQMMPFALGHCAVLPNRIHLIWTLPPGDVAYGKRWRMIKTGFAGRVREELGQSASGIWQRRYWEQPVTGPVDLAQYEEVIRMAPVQDGLVKRPETWRFSSFARRPIYDQPWSVTLAG